MTRVSENSNHASLNYSLSKAKKRLEDLQLKGSSLKRMVKPSDDPIGNVDLLSLRSRIKDNGQYKRNVNYASAYLEFTENAIADLSEIIGKAKEIAVAQSSDTFGDSIRKNVAKEVEQLRNQALAISNRRLGSKYIFGGYKTSQKPFSENGDYLGDEGHSFVEVSKDFYIPLNLTGSEVFFLSDDVPTINENPIKGFESLKKEEIQLENDNPEFRQEINREPASSVNETRTSLFNILDTLKASLYSGSSEGVQSVLNSLDEASARLVTIRTKLGSVTASVATSETALDNDNLVAQSHKSKIADADITELFSELEKQKNILQATYKSSTDLIDRRLIDFLR